MSSVRHLAAVVAVSVALGACGSSTTSPAALGTSSASPSGSPIAGSSPTPTTAASPTSAPTLSPKELGALYLKVATAANKAEDAALKAYLRSNQGLTAVKREYAAFAQADLTFIRGVQAIPFTPKFTSIVSRLLHDQNLLYVYERAAATAHSLATFNSWAAKADRQGGITTGNANELRLALGLPPVPIK